MLCWGKWREGIHQILCLVIGIWGMGGIGKTTLAAVVYDRISHRFDVSCFLADVSKVVSERFNLVRLQIQLLCETLKENLKIWDDHKRTNLISTRFRHLKTLIVIDNVDHSEQLEKLAGESKWFGDGSRIIITTRDEHILKEHGVKEVYKAEILNDNEALQLLCRKAFKSDDPLGNFQEMSQSVLEYAKALPLVIKVLGSSLSNKTEKEWDSALATLKTNPNKEVMGVLETSFKHVEEVEKEIFIDIACFFKGAEENYAIEILGHCGFEPVIGIRNLLDKSLISIVNGTFWMHDMLQELGWKFSRRNFPADPAKWSRLWLYKDLQVINTGTENVEAIVLNQEDLQETPLKAEALSQMSRLRLLIFPNVKFSGNLNNLSNLSRLLSWHKYPFTYLPSSFEPNGLIELNMPDSNIRQLWKGIKKLPNLTSINLRGSKNLIKTPNLSGVVNLEQLDLKGCTGLLQVDASIGVLEKLKFLNLSGCEHLISIPNSLFVLSSLETLNFSGCSKLAKRLNFDGP